MGNGECKGCEEGERRSWAYGVHEIEVDNDREYCLVRKSMRREEANRASLEHELERRAAISCIYLVKLLSYAVREDEYLLDVEMRLQYVSSTLADKVQRWQLQQKTPSESELSNILLSVETALVKLYEEGVGHRCVNFQTVLCFNSMYKLTDMSMITFLTGYDLARQGDSNQILSPKLLTLLQYESTLPDYELEDDLFSLGLLIIAIVMKIHPKEYYVQKEGRVRVLNERKVEEGVKAIERNYSAWIGRKIRRFVWGALKESQQTNTVDSPYRFGK